MSIKSHIEDNLDFYCQRLKIINQNGAWIIYGSCCSGFHEMIMYEKYGKYNDEETISRDCMSKVYGKHLKICDTCLKYLPDEFISKIKGLNEPKSL